MDTSLCLCSFRLGEGVVAAVVGTVVDGVAVAGDDPFVVAAPEG
jgi:hypothetical protein